MYRVAQPAPRARSARPPARSAGDTVARRIVHHAFVHCVPWYYAACPRDARRAGAWWCDGEEHNGPPGRPGQTRPMPCSVLAMWTQCRSGPMLRTMEVLQEGQTLLSVQNVVRWSQLGLQRGQFDARGRGRAASACAASCDCFADPGDLLVQGQDWFSLRMPLQPRGARRDDSNALASLMSRSTMSHHCAERSPSVGSSWPSLLGRARGDDHTCAVPQPYAEWCAAGGPHHEEGAATTSTLLSADGPALCQSDCTGRQLPGWCVAHVSSPFWRRTNARQCGRRFLHARIRPDPGAAILARRSLPRCSGRWALLGARLHLG